MSRRLSVSPFLVLLAATASAEDDVSPKPDKPRASGVVVHDDAAAYAGYTLFAPIESTTTYLVDMNGEVVHTWESAHPPGVSVYLLDNGHLLRAGEDTRSEVFHGGGAGGHLQEFDPSGELVWDYTLSDKRHMQHHDLEPLPNGNLLVITWGRKSPDAALAAGRDPARLDREGLWPTEILEIEPVRPADARVVWRWHAWDHLVQEFDPKRDNHARVADHPERLDINFGGHEPTEKEKEDRRRMEEEMARLGYVGGGKNDIGAFPRFADMFHVNAVEYVAEHDLIVLSSHMMSEVYVIDHSTTTAEAAGHEGGRYGRGGDLLYRFGNPRNYGAGGPEDQRLFGQHDPTWLPGGRLLLFNNGPGRPDGEYSSADEYELPFDAETGFARDGDVFPAPALRWTYAAPDEGFYSSFISGAQRLPNGNTLICSGAQGRVFEVTAEGEVVWDFWNPFGGETQIERPWWDKLDKPGQKGGGRAGLIDNKALFRATRIAADAPAIRALLR